MNKEILKDLLPIMQAFVDGKKIEYSNDGNNWIETETPNWNTKFIYRVKPEPKYRPFKTREECWYEISRHSFPQFLLRKEDKLIMTIGYIGTTGVALNKINNGYLFQEMFNGFTFIDGEPFGIKENN